MSTRIDPIRWQPVAALFGTVVLLAIVGAVLSLRPTASARPEPAAIILIATTTPAAPTVAPKALLGFFDYDNPRSATAFMAGDVARVVGLAGDWRLIETRQGGRAWLRSGDVPAGVASVAPLPNLAPAPTPIVVYLPVPVEQAPAPTVERHTGERPSDKLPATRVAPQQVR